MKIFERIIKNKIMDLTVNQLDPRHHGFLSGRSCSTNLVPFCESLSLSLNCNRPCDDIQFDCAKACASVNHDIILHKFIYSYNIDGTLLKFLNNYLSGRNQKVNIGIMKFR